MKTKMIAVVLVLSCLFSVNLTGLQPVFAMEELDINNKNSILIKDFDKISDLAQKTIIINDEKLRETIVNVVKDEIEKLELKISVDFNSLDFKNSNISKVDDIDNLTAITIPIVDDDFTILSNLTILFNDNMKVISYSELNVFKSKENTFEILILNDGKETYRDVTNIEFIENSEIKSYFSDLEENITNDNISMYGLDIPCFVAVSGAGGTISGLILKLCGAPCTLAPPVCAVCLGGIAVIGGVISCWK